MQKQSPVLQGKWSTQIRHSLNKKKFPLDPMEAKKGNMKPVGELFSKVHQDKQLKQG